MASCEIVNKQLILESGEQSPLFSRINALFKNDSVSYAEYIRIHNGIIPKSVSDEKIWKDAYPKDEITNKIVTHRLATLADNLEKDENGYTYLGEKLKRVTEVIDKYIYEPVFGDKKNSTEWSIKSVNARTKGTIHHSYAEHIMRLFADGKTLDEVLGMEKDLFEIIKNDNEEIVINDWREAYKNNHLVSNDSAKVKVIPSSATIFGLSMKNPKGGGTISYFPDFVKFIHNLHNDINSAEKVAVRGKPKFYFEKQIVDINSKLAGTIDLLVVYDDGSAAIYDYKFKDMQFVFDKNLNRFVSNKTISEITKDAHNMQLGTYRKMLMDAYGIKKFYELRIVPIAMGYDAKGNVRHIELKDVNTTVEESPYTEQLPFIDELTNDVKIDNFIQNLRKIEKQYKAKVKANFKDEYSINRMETLRNAINNLLINKDLSKLNDLILSYHSYLIGTVNNIDFQKLNQMKELTDSLSLMISWNVDYVKNNAKIFDDVDSMVSNQLMLNNKLEEVKSQIINIMSEKLNEEFNTDLTKSSRELGISSYFENLSRINNPFFRALKEIISKSFKSTQDATKVLTSELKTWKDKLGDREQEIYDMVIDQEAGKIINMYNKELFDNRQELIDNSKIDLNSKLKSLRALKKLYKPSNNWKVRYDALYNKKLSDLVKTGADKKYIDYKMKMFELNFDISKDEAWLSEKAYDYGFLVLTNPEVSYSEKFKKVKNDKLAFEFYEWYKMKMGELEAIAHESEYDPNRTHYSNFIPNIRKSMLEKFMNNWDVISTFKSEGKDFLDSLNSNVIYENQNYIDDNSDTIPIHYETVIEASEKSYDLLSSMLIYGRMAYNAHNMRKIEDLGISLRYLMSDPSSKALVTDASSNVIIDKITGFLKTGKGPDNMTLDIWNKFFRYYVYDRKIQNKDYSLGGISTNKVLMKLMSYLSNVALGLNPPSAISNFSAEFINGFISGNKGQFYTKEQMKKALSMFSKNENDGLWRVANEYFLVENDNWVQHEANKLRPSKIRANLTYDKMHIMHEKGSEFVSGNILIAMMQSYGLTDQGLPTHLRNLPEGSKSLFELSSTENDQFKIEGLSDKGYVNFRRMVQYVSRSSKGSNLSEDIAALQTVVGGRAVMHFRRWIAPMLFERFQGTRYTQEVEDFEMGRYRILFGEMFNKSIKEKASIIGKLMLDIGLGHLPIIGNTFQLNVNNDTTKLYFEKYLKENPDSEIVEKLSSGEMNYDKALERFGQIRLGQLRAHVMELRIASALILSLLLLGADWDDDGEPNWKEVPGGRFLKKILEKVTNELTFFLSPSSTNEILKAPIPIMGLLSVLAMIPSNAVDETLDYIFGNPVKAGKNKGKLEREGGDTSDWFHYTKRSIPVVKPVIDIMDYIISDDEVKK